MNINDIKENTLRNYAILILLIIASYLTDFRSALYCLIGGGIVGLIFRYSYMMYIMIFRKQIVKHKSEKNKN